LLKQRETNKMTAGVFLDTLSALAYKTTKKNGEFVLPGFAKLVKEKRKARTGFNPETQQKLEDSSQNRAQIPRRQSRKGRSSRSKKVVRQSNNQTGLARGVPTLDPCLLKQEFKCLGCRLCRIRLANARWQHRRIYRLVSVRPCRGRELGNSADWKIAQPGQD
jgi:nucleoid DNA-binding protein